MARRRDVLDLCSVERRKVRGGTDLARKIEMRRTCHALDGNDIGEPGIRIDMTADDVEKVDEAAILQALRYREALGFREAASDNLVRRVAKANDEAVAHSLSDGREHIKGEAQAIIQGATIAPVQGVGQRRPELVHEVAVGL